MRLLLRTPRMARAPGLCVCLGLALPPLALPPLVPAQLAPAPVGAQDAPAAWQERLRQVVPAAHRFGERQGEPPVFRAYRTGADGREAPIGYAFLTSDVPPEQMGFDGPIEVLVGMDLTGTLTGVQVIGYVESLRRSRGDFLARPGFQGQFAGKSVADAFQVRRDVDGITGATITVDAMARGIRNAARRVAVAHGLGSVAAASAAPLLDPVTVTLEDLEPLSWSEMGSRGLVQQLLVLDDGRTVAELSLLPLRDEAVAEQVIGPGMLGEVRERAGPRARERHLVLVGVDGPMAGALNLARLTVAQGDDTLRLEGEDVLLFGPPREGKLDGQVRFVRVVLLDRALDLASPFTFVLDLRPGLGVYTAAHPGRREASAEALLLESTAEEALSVPPPPSPDASGPRVLRLALLLALALAFAAAAFVSRRERLRRKQRSRRGL